MAGLWGSGAAFGDMQAQEAIQRQAMAEQDLELKKLMVDRQRLELNKQRKESSLLENAFSGTSSIRSTIDEGVQESSLINKFMQTGQRLMPINPQQGMAFIRQAEDMTTRNYKRKEDLLDQQAKIQDQAGAISYQVKDQESLNAATQQLSALGIIVPSNFRTFSPLSQEYFRGLASTSKYGREAIRLDQNEARLMQQQKIAEERERSRLVAEQDKDRKFALQQDKFAFQMEKFLAQQEGTSPSRIKVEEEAALLAKSGPGWGSLDSDEALRAATDVRNLADDYIHKGMNRIEAVEKAREQVTGSFTKGTFGGRTYKGMSKTDKTEDSNMLDSLPEGAVFKGYNKEGKKVYEVPGEDRHFVKD